MIIYYIIFGLTIILAMIDMYKPIAGKQGEKVFWFTIILIALFKGLRWDTGTDFPQYYACFENVTWSNFYHFERYGFGSDLMEPGYTFLNVLSKTIIDDYTIFLLWTNLAIMWVYGKTILTYVPQYKFSCLALVLISTILFPVRQTFAVATLLFSLRYIITKNLKKYLFCVLIAFSFHRSAIFLIFMYPILISKFNYKRNIIIYIALILSSNYMYSAFDYLKNSPLNAVMGGIMDEYDATNINNIENETDKNNNILTYLSSIFQLSLYYFGYHKMRLEKNGNIDFRFYNIMLNAYFLNLCFWAISFIPGFGSMNRMPAYFEFGYPFCITLTMIYFRKINKEVVALLIFMCTFSLKYQALNLQDAIGERGVNIFVPYKSFLHRGEPMRSGNWVY